MVRAGLVLVALVVGGAGLAAAPEDQLRHVVGGGVEGFYILNVPDGSQPPPNPLGVPSVDNWCAPLAAANALVFLDQVAEADWARGATGGLAPGTLSAYLGHFMAMNGAGSPDRANARARRPGTLTEDIPAGIVDFAAWAGNPHPAPCGKKPSGGPPSSSAGTSGTRPSSKPTPRASRGGSPSSSVSPTGTLSTPGGDPVTLTAYGWGEPLGSTASLRKEDPKVPEEEWDEKGGIGHAVTGVGVVKDRERVWVIVHDTWSTTPEDVAIPWDHVVALVRLGPG